MVALTAPTFAVIEGGTAGITAVAGAAAVLFVRTEARQPHPVRPLGLFRDRAVRVAGAACSVAFYGTVFLFSLGRRPGRGRADS